MREMTVRQADKEDLAFIAATKGSPVIGVIPETPTVKGYRAFYCHWCKMYPGSSESLVTIYGRHFHRSCFPKFRRFMSELRKRSRSWRGFFLTKDQRRQIFRGSLAIIKAAV